MSKGLFVENCFTDVSERCGRCVCPRLSECCYLAKWGEGGWRREGETERDVNMHKGKFRISKIRDCRRGETQRTPHIPMLLLKEAVNAESSIGWIRRLVPERHTRDGREGVRDGEGADYAFGRGSQGGVVSAGSRPREV